jgi:hypothetical protein
MGMHQTFEAFEAAATMMKRFVGDAVTTAYQLGQPGVRANEHFFDGVEYERDEFEERILVEVRYGLGRLMGRGRTHYTQSPVFSEAEGYRGFRTRLQTMLEKAGYEVGRIDVVHLTESDCWGLLVGLKAQ